MLLPDSIRVRNASGHHRRRRHRRRRDRPFGMARQPWARLVRIGSAVPWSIDIYEDEVHFGNAKRMAPSPDAVPRLDGDTLRARRFILMLAQRAASERDVHTIGRFAQLGPDLLMLIARSITPTLHPCKLREVRVNDCRISASHCWLIRRETGALIVDCSSNGTWLNHARILRTQTHRLKLADTFTLLAPGNPHGLQPTPALMLPVLPGAFWGAVMVPPTTSYTFKFMDLRMPPPTPPLLHLPPITVTDRREAQRGSFRSVVPLVRQNAFIAPLVQPRLVRQNAFIWDGPPEDASPPARHDADPIEE